MNGFEIDDRVRVKRTSDCPSDLRGQVGTIVAFAPYQDGQLHPVEVRLDGLDGPYNRRMFSVSELEPEFDEPLADWEKELLYGVPITPFEQALDATLAEVRAVMVDRHKKYGPGNILRHGEMGVVVRLGDKYERLDHSREVEFADEAVDDTADDIIGYGLIFKMLRAGSWPGQKPTAS